MAKRMARFQGVLIAGTVAACVLFSGNDAASGGRVPDSDIFAPVRAALRGRKSPHNADLASTDVSLTQELAPATTTQPPSNSVQQPPDHATEPPLNTGPPLGASALSVAKRAFFAAEKLLRDEQRDAHVTATAADQQRQLADGAILGAEGAEGAAVQRAAALMTTTPPVDTAAAADAAAARTQEYGWVAYRRQVIERKKQQQCARGEGSGDAEAVNTTGETEAAALTLSGRKDLPAWQWTLRRPRAWSWQPRVASGADKAAATVPAAAAAAQEVEGDAAAAGAAAARGWT